MIGARRIYCFYSSALFPMHQTANPVRRRAKKDYTILQKKRPLPAEVAFSSLINPLFDFSFYYHKKQCKTNPFSPPRPSMFAKAGESSRYDQEALCRTKNNPFCLPSCSQLLRTDAGQADLSTCMEYQSPIQHPPVSLS